MYLVNWTTENINQETSNIITILIFLNDRNGVIVCSTYRLTFSLVYVFICSENKLSNFSQNTKLFVKICFNTFSSKKKNYVLKYNYKGKKLNAMYSESTYIKA